MKYQEIIMGRARLDLAAGKVGYAVACNVGERRKRENRVAGQPRISLTAKARVKA